MTCDGCGMDMDRMAADMAELRRQVQRLEEEGEHRDAELAEAEAEAKRQRGTIAALKRELTKLRNEDPKMEDARKVFAYFVTRLQKSSRYAFDEKRQSTLLTALKHHTVEELCLAADGLAIAPYVSGKQRVSSPVGNAKRYAEFEHAYRDSAMIGRAVRRALEDGPTAAKRAALTKMGLDPDSDRTARMEGILLAVAEMGFVRHSDGTVTWNGEPVRHRTDADLAKLDAQPPVLRLVEDEAA